MRYLILILSLISGILNSNAQNREVMVLTKVSLPDIEQKYPEKLKVIENELSRSIITAMNDRFTFLTFTEVNADYLLELRLMDPNKSGIHSPRNAIVCLISLHGNQTRSGNGNGTVTIPIKESGPIYYYPPSSSEFVNSIKYNLITNLDQFRESVIDSLLSNIPIASEAFYLSRQKTWAVPASFLSNRIGLESQILIECKPSDPSYPRQKVLSRVDGVLCDIEQNHKNYKLPANYPVGSLLVSPLKPGFTDPDSVYRSKTAYVTSFNLFKREGLVFDSNLKCDAYNPY